MCQVIDSIFTYILSFNLHKSPPKQMLFLPLFRQAK